MRAGGRERDAVGTGVCVWACELGRDMRRENTPPILLSLVDCTSQFSLGGMYVSSAMHLLSKGRINKELATGFVFSLEWLNFHVYSQTFIP